MAALRRQIILHTDGDSASGLCDNGISDFSIAETARTGDNSFFTSLRLICGIGALVPPVQRSAVTFFSLGRTKRAAKCRCAPSRRLVLAELLCSAGFTRQHVVVIKVFLTFTRKVSTYVPGNMTNAILLEHAQQERWLLG